MTADARVPHCRFALGEARSGYLLQRLAIQFLFASYDRHGERESRHLSASWGFDVMISNISTTRKQIKAVGSAMAFRSLTRL